LYEKPILPLKKENTPLLLGIGLPRTGSASLCEALKVLGFSSYHFPLLFRTDPDAYLDHYNAISDWVTLGWRPTELIHRFPHAKMIYTSRSLEPWLDSMRYLYQLLTYLAPKSVLLQFEEVFGVSKQEWMHFYYQYEEEITHLTSQYPTQILHFSICDFDKTKNKWVPLCEFLQEPLPKWTIPFPHQREVVLQLKQLMGL
jgi:hypothetical protein